MKLAGLAASSGTVVAPVVVLRADERDPVDDPVVALRRVARELEKLAERNEGVVAEILEAQAMLATDPELLDRVAELAGEVSAAEAIRAALQTYKSALASARGDYQRERIHDLEEIERRAIGIAAGRGEPVRSPPTPGVLAALSVSPADTGHVPRSELLGIISGDGGPLSHAAIVSRALGIPAVVAVGERVGLLEPGRWVRLDGDRGTVEVLNGPPADVRVTRRAPREGTDARRGATADGHMVRLLANVGSVEDTEEAVRLGADGCGLLRTEFAFADRREPPTVAEQAAIYEQLAAPIDGQITVRALDAGADKPLGFVDHGSEPNPALGRRGVRLLLARPDLLRDQARALCRCSAAERIRFMLPMVTRAIELREVRELLEPVFAEEGRRLALGAMIEVPVAAIAIEEILRESEFVSLGTNDLFQYLFAADRSQTLGGSLIEPMPTAVWGLLAEVIGHAAEAGVEAGVCGELAGEDPAGGVLWALGAASLSVSPHRLPALKDQLAARTAEQWRGLAASVLNANHPTKGRDQHA